MQIVLSGNRIIAHGGEYIAMGGTVICKTTGKCYQNATVAECEGCPADIDTVGYEYHAGEFVPCAPYGMDNGEGYIMLACKECATPKNSGRSLDDMLGARLTIAAEFGSRVICTNGERTVYPKEKTAGLWWIDLPAYGKWTVKATLGDVSGEQTINVDVLKEYHVYFGYGITVEYPAGAACTCSMGETVLTAPDTSGSATFVVYAPGTWTVSVTNGEKTVSFGVEIEGTENELHNVKMNFTPEVSATPENGVTYIEGIEGISWADLSRYAKAIGASGIEKTAPVVYLNDANVYRALSIGDTKTYNLYGTVYTAKIIGFAHDDVTDAGTYGSAKAGITFETVELIKEVTGAPFTGSGVWRSGSTSDMWNACYMRTMLETILANFESDLQNVIVPVNKAYDDQSTVQNTSTALSSDKYFALSEMELTGTCAVANVAEGEQYSYYAAGNSKIKKVLGGTAGAWWTRSSSSINTEYICCVSAAGEIARDVGTIEKNYCGAFCI